MLLFICHHYYYCDSNTNFVPQPDPYFNESGIIHFLNVELCLVAFKVGSYSVVYDTLKNTNYMFWGILKFGGESGECRVNRTDFSLTMHYL